MTKRTSGKPKRRTSRRRVLTRNDLYGDWDRVNFEQRQAEKAGDDAAIAKAKTEVRRVYQLMQEARIRKNTAKPDKITIEHGKYAWYVQLHHGAQSDTWRRGPYKRERAFVSREAAFEHAKKAFRGVPIDMGLAANPALAIGQSLVLPAGHRIGMGRLRADTAATISRVDADDSGRPIYGVRFTTKGRDRTTWLPEAEAVAYAAKVARNRRRKSRRNAVTDVGNIIAQQLGGVGRLRVMLNAKNIYTIENGLQFGFAGRRETGNKLVIKLEPSDTYRVEFWWVRGANAMLVKAFDDIYSDQLIDVFEKQTGLYLTMHPRRNSRRKKKRTSRRRR